MERNIKQSCSGSQENKMKRKHSNEEEPKIKSQSNPENISSADVDIQHDRKRARLNFNFWQKDDPSQNTQNSFLQINELPIGKISDRKLEFRVTSKTFPRNTTTGPIISFHGLDNTGEIAFIRFGNNCENLYKLLEINSIYTIENFLVEKENPNYVSGTGNPNQIKLNPNTRIILSESQSHIREIPFCFIDLQSLENTTVNTTVDIMGVLVENFGLEYTSRGIRMRDISLTDQSKGSVLATLWSEEAGNFNCDKFSAIAIRKATVTEFEGRKKLNCLSGCLVWCNPKITGVTKLENWFKSELDKAKNE